MTDGTLAGLVQGRKVFDLGMELYHGMPHHPMQSPFVYQMIREHGDLVYGEGVTAAVDIFGRSRIGMFTEPAILPLAISGVSRTSRRNGLAFSICFCAAAASIW